MRLFLLTSVAAINFNAAQAQTPPALPAWPIWSNWASLGYGHNPYPIMVWETLPSRTTVQSGYSNAATAAIGEGINVFLNYGCPSSGFGVDDCGFASIPAAAAQYGKSLVWVGGTYADQYYFNSSIAPYETVSSITAMVSGDSALRSLSGFNNGDEPFCGGTGSQDLSNVPAVVARTNSDDPTRPQFWNNTGWLVSPSNYHSQACETQYQNAEAALNTMSADEYPLIKPYYQGASPGIGPSSNSALSNFGTGGGGATSNDSLWIQGVLVSEMVQNAWTKTFSGTIYRQPVGVALTGGGDAFGFSEQNNVMQSLSGLGGGQVTSGSSTLVNNTDWSKFSPIWIGLQVSGVGIPTGTTIIAVSDATHATMSANATTTAASDITVTGGVNNSDCIAGTTNLCVVNGNEYRETGEEAAAEAWMSVIAGSDFLYYFPYDTCSYTFVLGDASTCGVAATAAFNNVAYINSTIQPRHAWLNVKTTALATMDSFNRGTATLTTSTVATSGPVTVVTANSKVPGHVRVTGTAANVQVVFAQPLRRGVPGSTTGETTLNVTNAAWAGGKAAVITDTDQRYHASRALA